MEKTLHWQSGNLSAQPSSATNYPWDLGDASEPPSPLALPPVIQLEVDITWLWGPPGSRRRSKEAQRQTWPYAHCQKPRAAAGTHTTG